MKSFLKSILKGIRYFFTPFLWAILMAVGLVGSVLIFVGYIIYGIFAFFTGRNVFKHLPEDVQVLEYKKAESRPRAVIEATSKIKDPFEEIYGQPEIKKEENPYDMFMGSRPVENNTSIQNNNDAINKNDELKENKTVEELPSSNDDILSSFLNDNKQNEGIGSIKEEDNNGTNSNY